MPLPFSVSFSDRFDWGTIEIRLDIQKGIITSCQIFTDSMDESLPDKISKSLINAPLDLEKIKENLNNNINKNIVSDIISVFIDI